MRSFWSVKSPFPAASRSDAASNSFRCTNLPSCSRKRSRPFLSGQNIPKAVADGVIYRAKVTLLSRPPDHFRNQLRAELTLPTAYMAATMQTRGQERVRAIQPKGLPLRRDRLQPMPPRPGFTNPQQNGESQADKSQDREDPHA